MINVLGLGAEWRVLEVPAVDSATFATDLWLRYLTETSNLLSRLIFTQS